jgi:hypothetical protein
LLSWRHRGRLSARSDADAVESSLTRLKYTLGKDGGKCLSLFPRISRPRRAPRESALEKLTSSKARRGPRLAGTRRLRKLRLPSGSTSASEAPRRRCCGKSMSGPLRSASESSL